MKTNILFLKRQDDSVKNKFNIFDHHNSQSPTCIFGLISYCLIPLLVPSRCMYSQINNKERPQTLALMTRQSLAVKGQEPEGVPPSSYNVFFLK